MKLLDLTLETPAENLALDEALLEEAERAGQPREVLRLWESPQLMIVVGSSTHVADEVDVAACRRLDVPVLRRPSGGSPIVAGPGCLMYSVVLSYQLRPELRLIDRAHRFVLDTIAAVLSKKAPAAKRAGTSDLVIGERKFSGNSLRCKRDHFLYHGTLLYNFPLERIGQLLNMPARQPAYRKQRTHSDFLMNLPLKSHDLRQALRSAFSATEPLSDWPRNFTERLVADKYSRAEWNERF